MNSIFETIPLESLPLPGLSLENIAGEAYLKIDSAEFGFVEYKASILERRPTERKAALLSKCANLRLPGKVATPGSTNRAFEPFNQTARLQQ